MIFFAVRAHVFEKATQEVLLLSRTFQVRLLSYGKRAGHKCSRYASDLCIPVSELDFKELLTLHGKVCPLKKKT